MVLSAELVVTEALWGSDEDQLPGSGHLHRHYRHRHAHYGHSTSRAPSPRSAVSMMVEGTDSISIAAQASISSSKEVCHAAAGHHRPALSPRGDLRPRRCADRHRLGSRGGVGEMFDDFLARRPAREGEDHSIFSDDDYRKWWTANPAMTVSPTSWLRGGSRWSAACHRTAATTRCAGLAIASSSCFWSCWPTVFAVRGDGCLGAKAAGYRDRNDHVLVQQHL